MMWFRWKRTFKLGAKSLLLHKLRSVLTTLGIIFGVSSVIAMLAIGEGASRQAQEQIVRLGSLNLILKTVTPPQEQTASGKENRLEEYGLTYKDAERIHNDLPQVEVVVPLRRLNREVWHLARKASIEIIGTVPWYPEISPVSIRFGRFLSEIDMQYQQAVCVIDSIVSRQLFFSTDPVEKCVKVGTDYYRVVGVVTPESPADSTEKSKPEFASASGTTGAVMGNLYLPLTAMKTRFGELSGQFSGGTERIEKVELQQITVKVKTIEQVLPTRDVLDAMLQRTHKKQDYQIVVPLELLRQAARTRRIFSIVLGSIAAISLLVGGIGIMNIMLASVSERTREIGIRRALGARRRDIIRQFLTETVMLTLAGGMLGILLGMGIPWLVTLLGDMPTVITPLSVVLAFGISGAVGITFGLYPAWCAANLDPIESLRHE